MIFTTEPLLPNPTRTLHLKWDGPVFRRFIYQAQRNPSSLAIIDDQTAWTYGELDDCSSQLAHYLCDKGIGSQDVVAVYSHRSASLVLALLGILKAGAAFFILDTAYPSALLLDRLRIAKPRGWLSIEAAGLPPDRLKTFITESRLCHRFDVPNTPTAIAQTLLSDYPVIEPDTAIEPEDLSYIAFTSGTTGKPKAIQGLHKALPHFFEWYCKTFTLQRTDRFSMLSGLSYDAVLRDIFAPLWLGATLYIPSQDDISKGRIRAWLKQHEITVTHLTPATIQLLSIDFNAANDQVRSLRYLFSGGDILTQQHIAKVRQVAPLATCVNFYGATETPQAMSYYIVPNQETMVSSNRLITSKENIPLGQGIDNVQLLVLNESQQLADIGELGEIYIRTPYLAKGYLGDEELTRKRFILNPFTLTPKDRLYRTGDLGRYLSDGSVEFFGRNDQQVKLRGYRIELGEIEAALRQHSAVETAVVSVHENGTKDKFLVADLILGQVISPSDTEWRDFLARKIPDYMIPSVFIILDTLPLTPNGKIDRHALSVLDQTYLQSDSVSPNNLIEEVLAEIWGDVFGLEKIGRRDNFFELGGHSISAMQIISRVHEILGVEISYRQIFNRPTIAGLAEVINNKIQRSKIEPITQILAEIESFSTEEEQQHGQVIEKTRDNQEKLSFQNFLSNITDFKRRNEFLWEMNVRYWKPMLHVAQVYRSILARNVRTVAVTGTYGKTTTTRAVKAALGVHSHSWTDLNANCLSLVPMALMRQSPFRNYAVVEVGIDGPWQMELYATAIQPDIVVMTCIGNEHIQSFQNLHHLRNEKAEMVRTLSADGTAILNGDDPNVMWMATQTEAQIITFGFTPHCTVFASDVKLDWPNGTRFTLHAQGNQKTLHVKLIGQKMIYPLLAAAAVAITDGRPFSEVTTALEALPPTPGRLQPIHLPNSVIVLRDDYKSTVETIHTALDVLKQVEAERRIVVLGDIDAPPSHARPHYRAIGGRVAEIADMAIFVGKKFKDYRSGARREGMVNQRMRHARNIHEAIDILRDVVRARDVILVKGQEKQRLTRIVLALAGQKVRCRVDLCQLHLIFCDSCPMLDRNWNDV